MTKHQLIGDYRPLERKDDPGAPQNAEFKKLTEELMTTVASMRQKNDEHIDDLRKKKVDDVVLREHVDRINASIDSVQEKMQAEILAVKREAVFKAHESKTEAPELAEYKAKFDRYFRKGGERAEEELRVAEAKAIEAKALATNSEADGGFTVLPQVEQTMIDLQLLISPVRQIADVQQIGTGSLKKLVNKRGTAVGWVGETDPRAQTATSQLGEVEFVPGELYAMPAATQQMLDDSFINTEQWIASEVSIKMAQAEGTSFVTGDGVKKPKGFLAYTNVADASWAWGNIGYIASGASGDLTAHSATAGTGADVFFDMIAALKYYYRAGALFSMNRRSVAKMRKVKTTYADYLWVPGLQNGQADSFAGYPLSELEDMPDFAANSYSVAFGNFKEAYQIVDRVGIRVLRDPYTVKPYVLFYTTKRVGGGVKNFEAIKLLKAATS